MTYTNVRAATRLGAPFKVYVGEVSRFRVCRHSGLYAPAWQALFDQVLPTLAASRDVEPFDIEADYHVNIDGGSHEDGVIAVPTVEFGGLALLGMLTRGTPGYLDNPLRQNMFRAGHAHAGVWLVFALVALLWVDQTDLGEPWKWIVRIAFVAAPILMPLGFFLSVTRPDAQRPNGVIGLVYVAGLALAVGALTLGVGLLVSGQA